MSSKGKADGSVLPGLQQHPLIVERAQDNAVLCASLKAFLVELMVFIFHEHVHILGAPELGISRTQREEPNKAALAQQLGFQILSQVVRG